MRTFLAAYLLAHVLVLSLADPEASPDAGSSPGAQERPRRAPSQFLGMRGKRDSTNVEDVGAASGLDFQYVGDVMKGTPGDFSGVRDKKVPSGFLGMRGKKVPSGFLGMRGKKFDDDYLGEDLALDSESGLLAKRVPQGFLGMRGKKVPSGFLGMRGKKVPSGFLGMRGRRTMDEVAPLLTVDQLKQVLLDNQYPNNEWGLEDELAMVDSNVEKRVPSYFLGQRG
ncbi:tachykinin [Oratosquilla oratoria]|uniref:tachykinin n=1 Tax=Oratosquilla oratoria TaxID=337810 RepID=UPI003F76DB51